MAEPLTDKELEALRVTASHPAEVVDTRGNVVGVMPDTLARRLLATVARLQERVEEAEARLRKANCDYGDGWINDDLKCGIDVEPWCGKHAVLYYIRENKEARELLHQRPDGPWDDSGTLDPSMSAEEWEEKVARILKEE